MSKNPRCRVCGVKLNDSNWYPSRKEGYIYICKKCHNEKSCSWRKANPDKARLHQKANPEKVKARWIRSNRKLGHLPFNKNKDCPMFLGVHVAERVLSHVFKDVEVMPMNHPGYDFICARDKRIDIKSACFLGKPPHWHFNIFRNTTADYFLCLAFDNREDLNPLHAWLLPGEKFNHLMNASIRPSTTYKWNKYQLDISKINGCCDSMR